MINEHFLELKERLEAKARLSEVSLTPMANGGALITVANVPIEGWNRPSANILFVAPPGYPGAAPDCFWVEPAGFRLANGGTPQSSSDANPIPGDPKPGRSATWFSWHAQGWQPTTGTLYGFYQLILNRLRPAR